MIRIEFNKSDLRRILTALDRQLKYIESEENELPVRQSVKFYHKLIGAIASERFARPSWALTTEYATWKAKKAYPTPGFWKLDRYLLRSITRMAFGSKGQQVAIRPGATGKKGRSVEMYGHAVEHGTKFMRARPNWRMTEGEFIKMNWMKISEKTLAGIGMRWQ